MYESISGSANIDSYTSFGIYRIVGATQYESVWGTKYGIMIVINAGYIVQILLPVDGSYTSPRFRMYSSSWSSWWTFNR